MGIIGLEPMSAVISRRDWRPLCCQLHHIPTGMKRFELLTYRSEGGHIVHAMLHAQSVGTAGFEPATKESTAPRSTTELRTRCNRLDLNQRSPPYQRGTLDQTMLLLHIFYHLFLHIFYSSVCSNSFYL